MFLQKLPKIYLRDNLKESGLAWVVIRQSQYSYFSIKCHKLLKNYNCIYNL